jgi:hypothetical protein
MDISALNAATGVLAATDEMPQLQYAIKAFGKYFRATFCKLDHSRSPINYAYLYLRPNNDVASQFGLTREILCYVDDMQRLDNRAFDAISMLLERDSQRLVDDVIFFLSDAVNADALSKEYMERTGRKIIFCTWQQIVAAHDDLIFELLRRFLYARDFFDVSDPVSKDGDFFARYKLVDDIYDGLLDSQSAGIFGLRKIGKTSVIERLLKKNEISQRFRVARIDAQLPSINKNDAAGVALDICRAFNASWAKAHGKPFMIDIPRSLSIVDASRYFEDFIGRLAGQGKKLLVVIDELERILPSMTRQTPWNYEYIDFWRLLRTISQTIPGQFVFLVASTNPYFVETSKVGDEDNPLYKFLRARYLQMFTLEELGNMLRNLGKPMGITFEDGAIAEIHDEFGGHPFLSRQLCSAIRKDLPQRPLHISQRNAQRSIELHRSATRADIDSILKVFSDFYPEEFETLRVIESDERNMLKSFKQDSATARHLEGYGLLVRTKNSFKFSMSALTQYFKEVPPTEYRAPEIPDKARNRHLKLQENMNKIEPLLRSLIMAQFKMAHGKDWQGRFLANCSPGTRDKIDLMGEMDGMSLLEETLITDLFSVVNAHWSMFSRLFESRDEFNRQNRILVEFARNVADHRKLAVVSDDAKYVKASDACEWFLEKLS